MRKVEQERKRWRASLGAALAAAALLCGGFGLQALAQSNVANTAHNLSRTGPLNNLANVRAPAGGETEICVFCHTPHAASANAPGPLWNRSIVPNTYTRYTSPSLDANTILNGFNDQPGGSSVLCLSCHDGMLALGNVNVLRGKPASIALSNTLNDRMPPGAGTTSGFTRQIGTDLTNDHPISITYNDAMAAQDGEMARLTTGTPAQRDLINGNIIGVRSSGYKPLLPLEATGPNGSGQVQCATCHDPHRAGNTQKFLRLNRFQQVPPSGRNFEPATDQICLACHPKLGTSWAESAHANPLVADEEYLNPATLRRNFPEGTKVWQAACLNCHDTHSVQGSRRLLREGVETPFSGGDASAFRVGSPITPADTVSAIENTCYQCHDRASSPTRVIGTNANSTVPDIKTEFNRPFRMPITTTEQMRTKREVHDISNSDFIESPELLGRLNTENRHVECTDCHNPHRVRRSSVFYGTSEASGPGSRRTHVPGGTLQMRGADGNVASGVLRGTWGVEPVFGAMGSAWPQLPMSYTVKKGDPGFDTSTDKSKTYLTREYQLCFKCHSNYSNSDDPGNFPALGNQMGSTTGSPSQRNHLTRYTNVAAEFGSVNATDPPSTGTDQGESGNDTRFTPVASPPGVGANHRSWHPVMYPTGRTGHERTGSSSTTFGNIRAPFNTPAKIGFQTMYCSDCHGDPSSWTPGVGPNLNVTQGPHGSSKKFLLKGDWLLGNSSSQTRPNSPGVCGNCHNPTGGAGGFRSGDASHSFEDKNGAPCNFCHIAVPHGWKNKAFLVNLNCVGAEVPGMAAGCTSVSGNYTAPPYYVNARLKVLTWSSSNNWSGGNCFNSDKYEDAMKSQCGQW